jgi:hypothetical protein
MLKSVPYLAASLFSALLISLSAHADTRTPSVSRPQVYQRRFGTNPAELAWPMLQLNDRKRFSVLSPSRAARLRRCQPSAANRCRSTVIHFSRG